MRHLHTHTPPFTQALLLSPGYNGIFVLHLQNLHMKGAFGYGLRLRNVLFFLQNIASTF